jgi:hypothetical protein
MSNKIFPSSNLPIRKSVELLPVVFQTSANDKFLSAVVDPLIQPGVLDKVTGYVGRQYGNTFTGSDVYVDIDNTLRSKYQLETGVIYKNQDKIENFYDYLDFKNQIKFFGNDDDRDDKITSQTHYTWTPPIEWDKFINYREYFWVPAGPPSVDIFGQSDSVVSTYKVRIGDTENSFVFTPDSFTNNPTITLYRGQTYKFNVDLAEERFVIRTGYDSNSLLFDQLKAYPAGSSVIYNGKLWNATADISAGTFPSTTSNWEITNNTITLTSLDYNKGVTNNRIKSGTLTFKVPEDAPDILFYQGVVSADRFGRFLIADIETNTSLDVEKEILGKINYKSSNSVDFTNGMIVTFKGKVTPIKYSQDSWLVEGVGSKITLTQFSTLVTPDINPEITEVLFDKDGFDSLPFDDASLYPTQKDYITIAKNSSDLNPWSRYNRWFHRSVLENTYKLRGQDFDALETARAKRPIIEFSANLRLFNHGGVSKQSVDYIDTFTSDVFSTIEGSTGYNIDGDFLFDGARVLVVADTDTRANNKIYQVKFIIHNNNNQIHLEETVDSSPIINESILVQRGTVNGGKMFHFTGSKWLRSQEKTKVNQPPLFDAVDENGDSFSDVSTYPVSTFAGSKILSFKQGSGVTDTELGLQLSYLNINNVGDIQFEWNWELDSFEFTVDRMLQTKKIASGFYKFNLPETFANGWDKLSNDFIQPIINSQIISEPTDTVKFSTINWNQITESSTLTINFYLNGKKCFREYQRTLGVFVFASKFSKDDVVTIKLIADVVPDQGFYEIPVGLEKNPLNSNLESFTLGQAVNHVATALDFDNQIQGNTPGNSNLRDLVSYKKHASRFLKHAGLTPIAIMSLCDKTHNIIKSIQYSKKCYTDFKNNFILKSTEIEYNENINDFVDDIINVLSKTKNSTSPFSDSDMLGAGAFTSLKYQVEDVGIKTFSLSEKFDLDSPSRRAVYLYLNNTQMLHNIDYTFNSTFGFVSIKAELKENDIIEIREYLSTASAHVPATPTAIGLYKKFTPAKFIDDTYTTPRLVIQGHDGSITIAYNDFRDDLLLELEYRIFNNIKKEYNEKIFNIDNVIGGYYSKALYSKSQLHEIINPEFLKWVQNTDVNYTLNQYFDRQNSFTYTYNKMTDPTNLVSLPGYWRGVYNWFYDTDRPHRCPWEMLGFSQQPQWWEKVYGPLPYTKDNLLLWEDIQNGIIREGSRAGTYTRYARPTILNHLPVDGNGKLLSPLDSRLARNFSLINNDGPFVLGDISPAEYAWRSSSEWPFALVLSMCLLKPFEYITDNFNLLLTDSNKLGQIVFNNSGVFPTISDMVDNDDGYPITGLSSYILSYIKSNGISPDTLWNKLANIDVALSYRIAGFVDKEQQRFLLDSKSPNATNSSIYIPPENYDIIFNVSSPISSISYSGVILEKTEGGWLVSGYDETTPYFNYHVPIANNKDPLISVGGVSENFVTWSENKNFNNGSLVRYSNNFYRALRTHNSGSLFDTTAWKKLASIPMNGAVEALRRKTFNTLASRKMVYGSKFTSIQQVIDFFLGYENYLQSIGFTFDRYDSINQVSQDWLTSCKEFMFWTKHNWEVGSLIALSPASLLVDITVPVGVADSILDGFYDYQLLKADKNPLPPQFININRDFQNIKIEPVNTTEGIFYLKLYYVLKEHVTIFNDRTLFNDIIYDKTTGYRQGRIKTQGFRTTDWDGDYTSPGFLFDNVDIVTWKPFSEYKLGDIVAYRSYNWTSLKNQPGLSKFDDALWSRLDSTPTKQLISNFDYKIKEFSDFFEVSSEGIDQTRRTLARHTIGYQPRTYLQNLSEDQVTQFQLYQGFVREKGTANAITKVFGKLSRSGADSIMLNEEWAFRVGELGGVDQISEIEIQLEKQKFNLNPQPLVVATSKSNSRTQYSLTVDDFLISPDPFTVNINPTLLSESANITAGYVSSSQYEFVIRTRESLIDADISSIKENDHIWITFDKTEWNVLRLNESKVLYITGVDRTNQTSVDITLSQAHNFIVDDIIGIKTIENLTGFFKIINVAEKSVTIEIASTNDDPSFEDSTIASLHILNECRFANYGDVDQKSSALYNDKTKLFIDDNGKGLWEVVEKNKQYSLISQLDYSTLTPKHAGSKVIYDTVNKHILSSIPGSSLITCYIEVKGELKLKQIISPEFNTRAGVSESFGAQMAISPDGKYLVVGSPLAGINSDFTGPWESSVLYNKDDIVLYAGQLYKATEATSGIDNNPANYNNNTWEQAKNIPAYSSANGQPRFHQGMISIYEYKNNRYKIIKSLVSPRPAENEKFGSEIVIGFDGSKYTLAVSAVGSYNNTGRVYLYTGSNNKWEHLENNQYRGIYNSQTTYSIGDIVWQASPSPLTESDRGSLWVYSTVIAELETVITPDSESWIKIDDITTHCSLPTNISVEDDGSTLEFLSVGLIDNNQMAELVRPDDQFGFSMAMNSDASILVIGAPFSDGQYFENYKGIWRIGTEYFPNEIVRHYNPATNVYIYFKFLGQDYIQEPGTGNSWEVVEDNAKDPSGKIFVYNKSISGSYKLTQIVNSQSINAISDIDTSVVISTGDQFGFDMDLDASGQTLVVSSPRTDVDRENFGSAYFFSLANSQTTEYRLKQKLESFEIYPNEYFGFSVSVSPDASKVVIGARNASSVLPVLIDLNSTFFDNLTTTFYHDQGYSGAVYVFDKKDQEFFLTEKLEDLLSDGESFGYSVDCVGSIVLVGSPNYRNLVTNEFGQPTYDDEFIGKTRLFRQNQNTLSWTTLSQQTPTVDLSTIKSIELYDDVNNLKLQGIDYINPATGKILNIAEQEIKFKTPYDPAIYSIGTDSVIVDQGINWLETNVGKLWWDLSTVKWMHAEQLELPYRVGNWNKLAQGASVDVYEWIESRLLPNEWAALADTNEGIAVGISGQPLYPDNDVYSIKELYNAVTGEPSDTLYYYWVKNKAIVPNNVMGRQRSSAEVSNIISNPIGTGIPYVAFLSANSILTFNFNSIITSDAALLNIQYKPSVDVLLPVHHEYQLLTEGDANSLPTEKLENKWIDSLVGLDAAGNRVPDLNLPKKQKYGIRYRPRQSMFVDRLAALKIIVNKINEILKQQPFASTINYGNLNSNDTVPPPVLNLYDVAVDNEIDLQTVGTARTVQAELKVNLIDGELDTIEIVNPGVGYKTVPTIELIGNGKGASATLTLDNQGKIKTVTIVNRGKRYSVLTAKVRHFSILVKADSQLNNFWSIYSWDDSRQIFFRSKTQSFDTRKYWKFVDWWKPGYSLISRINAEVNTLIEENNLTVSIGDLIRIKEYGAGGWAVFEKVSLSDNFLDSYMLVGQENGTIALSDALYDTSIFGIGFDNTQSYDNREYDIDNSRELRNIFKAVKHDILLGDFLVEWNNLFFASIRYILAEQVYVDWVFKTSFLNAIHNVGSFEQTNNYKSDNLESYQDYINEVKPFRTTVREYISMYKTVQPYNMSATDFDLPPYFSNVTKTVVPVGDEPPVLTQYPWKWWTDNNGYAITAIEVYNSGSLYTTAPSVLITGNGKGAAARAYISNGKVSGISIISGGEGYTKTPTITLVGGNGAGASIAKASAVLGNTAVRTINTTIKFDRVSKVPEFTSFSHSEEFLASGTTSVFELEYAPSQDKTAIVLLKNNQIVLTNEYSISLYYNILDSYTVLRGKLLFATAPALNDVISIVYEKNISLLNAADRVKQHYNPVAGMPGNELNQLMTGVDFGGVQIQGTTFDVTGGWDALPWYADNWDSVESNSDYYHICDGSTIMVELPYVPTDGQQITIYLNKDNKTSRIDEVLLPTFVGDGSTNSIDVGNYIALDDGDILIFRSIESDGSVTITDTNLLDTQLSGGTISTGNNGSYNTANGVNAEDILISGGVFISPDQVPAPEENLPGQVLESLSIKVFHRSTQSNAIHAFEINKDMLNFYRFNRFSKGSVQLIKDLSYFDTVIEVNDASTLTTPVTSRNIPGIININNERIEYMLITGNTLSQLRRGAHGTAIGEKYNVGEDVVDVSYKEIIPYNESYSKTEFVSDGVSLYIGPLDFVPVKANRDRWNTTLIPDECGPCDQLEVFVAGRRLRKDPQAIWSEKNGSTSPAADIIVDAEFSVDGITNNIRLTEAVPAGLTITIIKRTGKAWYERGEITATSGVSLLNNATPPARFIAQRYSSLPE